LLGPVDWGALAGARKYCHLPTRDMKPKCGSHKYDEGLIWKAHMNGVDVYPGIGFDSASTYSILAASPEARAKFGKSCALIMTNYNFDGLVIDWRFPASAADRANFSLLLNEVRMALRFEAGDTDQYYKLSANVPCRRHEIEFIDIKAVNELLSELNLMTLDFNGPWNGEAGINSPLYDSPSARGSMDSCLTTYTEGGADRSKLNLALPFYGHSFSGAQQVGDKCSKNWDGSCSDSITWQAKDRGSPQYHSIYNEVACMEQIYDRVSMTPLAVNDVGIVSYDDPHSICLKVEYGMNHGVNGVIIMDFGGDLLDDNSSPLLDALNLKLLSPDIDCVGRTFGRLFEWKAVSDNACVPPETPGKTEEFPPETPGKTEEFPPETPGKTEELSNTDTNPEVLELEDKGPWFRYTCGQGEGDALARCSEPDLPDKPCNFGVCKGGMICFATWCTKREFIKPEPHRKNSQAKPEPAFRSEGDNGSVENDEGDDEQKKDDDDEEDPIVDESHSPNMTFSCGKSFAQAKSCSIGSCKETGIMDCPAGSFCFYVTCDGRPSYPSFQEDDQLPAIRSVEPTARPTQEPTKFPVVSSIMMYQCGETRKIALTCPLECGAAWQCPNGQDCYNVECPTV